MKILAAEGFDWESVFSEIESIFNRCGYRLEVDVEDSLPQLTLSKTDNFLPEIQVSSGVYNDDLVFDAIVSFPEINTVDFDHADDIEYYVKQWEGVATAVKELLELQIELDN